MTALLVLLGLLAALFTAVVILFTAGIVPAGVVLVIILVVMVAGIMLAGTVKKLIVFGFLILVIATLGFGGYSGYQLYSALTDTSGPADPLTRSRSPQSKPSLTLSSSKPAFASNSPSPS